MSYMNLYSSLQLIDQIEIMVNHETCSLGIYSAFTGTEAIHIIEHYFV